MIRRFQIEDLIAQDSSGVVFRALDTETGHPVAVRRFFPFGANGGGLLPEEQASYHLVVERLTAVRHPALRSVICGGCDPVDGMPFIVTEWIDGNSLRSSIGHGSLAAEAAIALIFQALDVCEVLSQVFEEEAIWVETNLQAIITCNEPSDRGCTFWIAPLKWLGDNPRSRGLEAIVTLTEEIMGWKYRRENGHANHGLSAWLKWLRQAAPTTTLQEVRERLAASAGEVPPLPLKNIPAQPTGTRVTIIKSRSSRAPWLTNFGLALVAIGLGAWLHVRQRLHEASLPLQIAPPAVAPSAANHPPADDPVKGQAAAGASLTPQPPKPESRATLADQQAAAASHGGVIAWTSRELLFQNAGKEVDVEGRVARIFRARGSLYLLFSMTPDKNDSRGRMFLLSDSADLSVKALERFRGKNVRLRGTVELLKTTTLLRPEILIRDLSSIRIME